MTLARNERTAADAKTVPHTHKSSEHGRGAGAKRNLRWTSENRKHKAMLHEQKGRSAFLRTVLVPPVTVRKYPGKYRTASGAPPRPALAQGPIYTGDIHGYPQNR